MFVSSTFPNLWKERTIALFKHSGSTRLLIQSLNSTVSTGTSWSSNFLKIKLLTQYWSCKNLFGNFWIVFDKIALFTMLINIECVVLFDLIDWFWSVEVSVNSDPTAKKMLNNSPELLSTTNVDFEFPSTSRIALKKLSVFFFALELVF